MKRQKQVVTNADGIAQILLETCNPNLRIQYNQDVRLRRHGAYSVVSIVTGEPIQIARYLPTIQIARFVAGVLSGMDSEWQRDDPRLKTREAAERAFGVELVCWLFMANRGFEERKGNPFYDYVARGRELAHGTRLHPSA
jgi:hypothetical protein